VQRLSSEKENLVVTGFLARTQGEERTCPGAEVKMLVSFEEVTAQIQAAQSGLAGEAASKKRQEAIAGIEKTCAATTRLRCDVVTLFRGGQYWVYRYKVWQDVRLVWAPERGIAHFGGDPDNFVYPRFALDASFLRVYENGRPLKPEHYLKLSREGVKEGDAVFSAGNPGSTDRALTLAELEYHRFQGYPIRLNNADDRREALREFGKASPEAARRASDAIYPLDNQIKVLKGESKALAVERLFQRKKSDEEELKRQAAGMIAAGTWSWSRGNDPWADIARAARRQHEHAFTSAATDYTFGSLLRVANDIVALAYETQKAEGDRLAVYRDARLPQVRRLVATSRAWHLDLEAARLAQKIDEAMQYLGQEHAFVSRLMQGRNLETELPDKAAKRIFADTRLNDVAVRKALVEGGEAAVNASTDSLIVLVRDLYPIWRAARMVDQQIEADKAAAHDQIAQLKFRLNGLNQYPDATGTLRLGYGKVAGFDRDGIINPATTTYYGLFDRNASFGDKAPFDLPVRWQGAEKKLNLATPFNFVTTLDIIGGSSGSPVVNAKGELVGVLFDGNLEELGNRFQFQGRTARSIAVDMRALVEALDKVYDAQELKRELTLHW
jgi:hypothetical protein